IARFRSPRRKCSWRGAVDFFKTKPSLRARLRLDFATCRKIPSESSALWQTSTRVHPFSEVPMPPRPAADIPPIGEIDHPQPPAGMAPEAAEIWNCVVGSMRAAWVGPEAFQILARYCFSQAEAAKLEGEMLATPMTDPSRPGLVKQYREM